MIKIIVISKHQEKLLAIKRAIERKTSLGNMTSYVDSSNEALNLVPEEGPWLLITSGVIGYKPFELGEDLIKKARVKNPTGKSILVTSEHYTGADYVIHTENSLDGGVDDLTRILVADFE